MSINILRVVYISLKFIYIFIQEMVWRVVPNVSDVNLSILLDCIKKYDINYIDLKVHMTQQSLEPFYITPSIKIQSSEGRVKGLKSIEEVKELFVNKKYQLLTLEIVLNDNDNTELKIDFMKHSIVQKSASLTFRPLSTELLIKEGIFGEEGITSFTDEYS